MDVIYQIGMNFIKMKRRFFLFGTFIFLSLVLTNFVSAVSYGSGVYGQGSSCVGSVTAPVTPPAGTFGGGGGVIEKYIYKGWEVIFEFNNITYTIKLEDVINNNTAVIKISGGDKNWNFNLGVNQTQKIDLNQDEIYDLSIYLKNISGDKIYLTANSIQEEMFPRIDFGEKEIKEYPILNLLIFTIILLLLIIIILIKIIVRRSSGVQKVEYEYRKKKEKVEHEIKRGEKGTKRKLKPAKTYKKKTEVIKPVLNKKAKRKRAIAEERQRKKMIHDIRKRKLSKK